MSAEWAWPAPEPFPLEAGCDLSERVTFSAAAAPHGVRQNDEELTEPRRRLGRLAAAARNKDESAPELPAEYFPFIH